MTRQANNVRALVMAGVLAVALTALTGCDVFGPVGWGGIGDLGDLGGWLGGFPPVTPLYDPTDTIQSVIEYRQNAMDRSAEGWSDYIRQ